MQDIVFYVAAKETLGKVRDYSNMRNSNAPLLTLGVAVCLRMRLFEDIEDSTPYPIASFSGVTDWQWRMDADFDRSTACKLVADADEITVHTVTDTVKGETMSFTEFVIPISNMNTEELAAWLGTDKVKTGLAGELVGYDNEGHAAFVLQIEDFSVRNRLAGLNDEDEEDPTPVDQEIVTRPVAEQMIQTAVSTLDAAKQDKLNSGNAGTGITISSTGVISTTNVPQSAVTGLVSALSSKQNALSVDFWIEINGGRIGVERYHSVRGPYSSGSVSLQAGYAYKILATNSAVTLNKENIPNNTWGMEGHAEIFVANTGYIRTGDGVVLANALEPDAVNNCTVRFHDGYAIISVEDHVAGYIVVSATGSTEGTLPYALSSATQEYVAFDATLNGLTLEMGGAATNGEKHVVGNGYTETVISGGINCISKTTVANLGLNGVVVSSGTLTLGDVYIPNGGTIAVSGGGLAVEKVTGDGTGVINLNSSTAFTTQNMVMSGLSVINGSNSNIGGAFQLTTAQSGFFTDVAFRGNTGLRGGAVCVRKYTDFTRCTFTENVATSAANAGNAVSVEGTASATFTDCSFGDEQTVIVYTNGMASFKGSNSTLDAFLVTKGSGTIVIESGAIIDLTGNTNTVTLSGGASGGKLTFAPGGATVYPSAGSASAYMLGGMTVPQIGNTNVVDLGGSNVVVPSGVTASASGCTIKGGSHGTAGGALFVSGGIVSAFDCAFNSNTAVNYGGALFVSGGTTHVLSSCSFEGNECTGQYASIHNAAYINAAKVQIRDCSFGTSQNISVRYGANAVFAGSNTMLGILGTVDSGFATLTSGAVIDLTGNSNATPIAPGGGITISSGGISIIDSAGSTHEFQRLAITGSTINNLGQIFGATVYVPVSSGSLGPWNIETTLGTSTVSATAAAQELVIEGGLVNIEEL